MSPDAAAGSACVPNIGARGRRRRLTSGFVWLGVGVAAMLILMARGAAAAWYFALVMPFTFAALGWFQARERT